jgi:hypothetical protein
MENLEVGLLSGGSRGKGRRSRELRDGITVGSRGLVIKLSVNIDIDINFIGLRPSSGRTTYSAWCLCHRDDGDTRYVESCIICDCTIDEDT